MATPGPEPDGSLEILARWPIEPAAPAMRSAEEIAREAIARRCWLGVETTCEVADVERARQELLRIIEQSRAEGAAAERPRQHPRNLAGRTWAGRVRNDGSVVIYTGRRPVASLGAEEVQELANEVSAPARDLAGRIRALVQEYAGRWADAAFQDERNAIQDCMRWMRHALRDARNCRDPIHRVMAMREDAVGQYGNVMLKAADELEAIVRECEEEKR